MLWLAGVASGCAQTHELPANCDGGVDLSGTGPWPDVCCNYSNPGCLGGCPDPLAPVCVTADYDFICAAHYRCNRRGWADAGP